MNYTIQHDSSDCGSACLSMIFSHYKRYFTITQIRDMAGTDINGTSFKGLADVCEKVGFRADGVRSTKEGLEIDNPCLAHMEYHAKGKGCIYRLLLKLKGNRILCMFLTSLLFCIAHLPCSPVEALLHFSSGLLSLFLFSLYPSFIPFIVAHWLSNLFAVL